MNQTQEDRIKEIRREFFAFRNGIVADTLRKAGDPHVMVMGCLLTDLTDIARRTREAIGDDDEALIALARALWEDDKSRECRLTAPMLYPAPLMTHDTALQWCAAVETAEVADNLCHKLLRHRPDADTLFRQLIVDDRALVKYTGYRLLLNRLLMGKVPPSASLRAIVEHEAAQAQAPLKNLLKDIMEELD